MYVKHNIIGQKNKHMDKRGQVTDGLLESQDGCGAGQGTSAEYEITNGHCVSPAGNHIKETT